MPIFDLQWLNGTKDLLGYVDYAGFAGGHRFAILVGACRNDSAWRFELVGSLPQRLVLVLVPHVFCACNLFTLN
jgi:hypothetical protein